MNTASQACFLEVAYLAGWALHLRFDHKPTRVLNTEFPGDGKCFLVIECDIASGKGNVELLQYVG